MADADIRAELLNNSAIPFFPCWLGNGCGLQSGAGAVLGVSGVLSETRSEAGDGSGVMASGSELCGSEVLEDPRDGVGVASAAPVRLMV